MARVVLSVLLGLACLAVAGCGSGDGEQAEDPAVPASSSSGAASPVLPGRTSAPAPSGSTPPGSAPPGSVPPGSPPPGSAPPSGPTAGTPPSSPPPGSSLPGPRPRPTGPPSLPTDSYGNTPRTVTGTVSLDATTGCVVVHGPNGVWSLLGEAASTLRSGQRVVVTGHPLPNVRSACDGTPLRVVSIRPG